MLTISIVVPTLNEEEEIVPFLRHVCGLEPGAQVIVTDGGSSDATLSRARELASVIEAPRGRSAQMNAGAQLSAGEILWFLHADCRPHADSPSAMRAALADRRVVGGGFEFLLDAPGAYFRLVEAASNGKNRLLRLLYGDMGVFVRREVFFRLGGYREIPLMEDMDFCARLKHEGRIVILPERITTSARRWHGDGTAWNTVRNGALQIAWALGADPAALARWYAFGNRKLLREGGARPSPEAGREGA